MFLLLLHFGQISSAQIEPRKICKTCFLKHFSKLVFDICLDFVSCIELEWGDGIGKRGRMLITKRKQIKKKKIKNAADILDIYS